MDIEYSKMLMTVINLAIVVAIIIGIIKCIREAKNFINRSKQMDKKLDIISNELEKVLIL